MIFFWFRVFYFFFFFAGGEHPPIKKALSSFTDFLELFFFVFKARFGHFGRAFLLLLPCVVSASCLLSREIISHREKTQKHNCVSFLHKNSCIKLSQQHIYSKTMAASTTSLSSSRGFSSKAQFVAGSRRPVSKRIVSRRNNNDVIVRAAAGGKKEEEKVCGENKADESTIAGKAVSAVVAAAISLSSAGQAAVAQAVRFFVVRALLVFSRCRLRLLIRTL